MRWLLNSGRQSLAGNTLTIAQEDSAALHAEWKLPDESARFSAELRDPRQKTCTGAANT